MNYTLNEYASDVVYRIASVCNARNIPHPMIIIESVRAVAAYHSVLIFDGVDRRQLAALGETRTPSIADLFVAVIGSAAQGAVL